jgi:ParB/RepB/Spo0J family partition protein
MRLRRRPRRRPPTPGDAMAKRKTPITAFPTVRNIGLHAIGYADFMRVRQPQQDKVDAIVASIRENGLLHPITIRPIKGAGFNLVAGRHRLAAAKKLGWKNIPCFVKEMSEDEAALAEIDENLARAELRRCAEASNKKAS